MPGYLREYDDYTLIGAQRVHRFTRDEIRRLMLSTIDATWPSAERKKQLAASFQRDAGWRDAAGVPAA